MTLYSAALFLHVVGALGLFAAMALEWVLVGLAFSLPALNRARGTGDRRTK